MSRLEFSVKTKQAAYARSGGRCENDECGLLFDASNPAEYDHVIEDYYDGGNSLDNCKVICRSCHKAKSRSRASVIAKSRRIIKKAANIRPKKRGFQKPDGYKYNWQRGRYERA
jgi:hypoxanthine-guanine phosphoribosyltransferase